MPKLEDYKGFEVWVTTDGVFEARKVEDKGFPIGKTFDVVAESASLEALRKVIDQLSRKRPKMNAWVRSPGGWGGGPDYQLVNVSSARLKKSYRGEFDWVFRVTWKNEQGTSSWSEEPLTDLLADSSENRGSIERIAALDEKVDELRREIQLLEDGLVRLTPEELRIDEEASK